MKKTYFLLASIITISINNYTVIAQCSAEIKGIPRVGSILKASTSSSDVQLINWKLNGNVVYRAYLNFRSKAVTVAGTGISGAEQNQLYGPGDVQVDDSGNVYVLDGYNSRVQKWMPGAISGITVAGGNGTGSAANQLFLPHGFFVDRSGNIYVADLLNNRVQKWAAGATSGITVAGGNDYGSAANQLASPNDVFVDDAGNIYITDGDNNRIQKWIPGATSGITVAGGNGYGAAANQLNTPFGLYVNKSGDIYISDRVNNRIQKWIAGATTGIAVAGTTGSGGSDSTELNSPRGLYVDSNGIIYIADYFNNRVQKWVPGIGYGITVAGGNFGHTASQLNDPSGVFINTDGNLFVADEGNNRIQKFIQLPINNKFIPHKPGSYRIRAFFSNGCIALSKRIIVTNATMSMLTNAEISNISIEESETFVVYPNPAHQYAILQFGARRKEKYYIEITDLSGRTIQRNNGVSSIGSNQVRLDVSNFSNGIYIISLINRETGKQNLKLYKE
jgi:sugar lactone lactonase YvrE